MHSIHNFLVWSDQSSLRTSAPREGGWTVFGEPMHASPEELVERLYTWSMDDFLASEARTSVGNYVLVSMDGDVLRVVTSPSYSGGYIYHGDGLISVGTDLARVLSRLASEPQMDPRGLSFYLDYAPRSNFNQLPLTTMFKDVQRVPPGSLIVADSSRIRTFRSFLNDARERPASFNQAMDETMQSVGNFFERNPDQKAAVMFSGGVDSLAIYLGIREKLGKENTKLYTMMHSSSNGPDRALPVAASLEATVTLVDNTIYEKNDALQKILILMDSDITSFSAPHLSFLGMDLDNTIVFSGQNFDALANIHMEILQETQEVGYYSAAAKRIAHTDNREQRQQRAFMKNLSLTDAYIGDPYFQKLTVEYFTGLSSNASPDPRPGKDGILRGLLSSQFPNILSKTKHPFNQVQQLDEEISLFRKYIGEVDDRAEVDLMRHLTYSHFSNKRITSVELGLNVRSILLAMSGPVTSYFLGRPRGLTEASQPKREIYAYAKRHCGMPYRQMIKTAPTQNVTNAAGRNADERVAFMLNSIKESLDPDNSSILRGLNDPKAYAFVSRVYTNLFEAIQRNTASSFQKQLAIKIYNLEAVLASAKKMQSEVVQKNRTVG